MFTITFPVDTGTFVKTSDGKIGTITCYQCVDETDGKDDFIVMVSGYKDAWCGEYLLSELEVVHYEANHESVSIEGRSPI